MDTVVAATVLPVTLQNEPIGRFVTDTDCVICIRSPILLLINNGRVHSGFDETILIKRRGLSGPIQLSGSMVESTRVICFPFSRTPIMFHYQRNAKMVRMGFITHCIFRKQFSFFSRDGIRNMAKKPLDWYHRGK